MSERVRLLVLQWAHEGRADDLAQVEDHLTAIARRYGGVTRERAVPFRDYGRDTAPPDEVHVLTFPDEEAFDAFLADEERPIWAERLAEVLARTEVVRLHPM